MAADISNNSAPSIPGTVGYEAGEGHLSIHMSGSEVGGRGRRGRVGQSVANLTAIGA